MRVAVSDKFSVGTWRHTVLELYALDGPWPTEGEPADWIEAKSVAFCQGDDETVVVFTPLWRILFWKARQWKDDVWAMAFNAWARHTPWGRRHMLRIDDWFESLPVVSDSPSTVIGSDVTPKQEGGVQNGA